MFEVLQIACVVVLIDVLCLVVARKHFGMLDHDGVCVFSFVVQAGGLCSYIKDCGLQFGFVKPKPAKPYNSKHNES